MTKTDRKMQKMIDDAVAAKVAAALAKMRTAMPKQAVSPPARVTVDMVIKEYLFRHHYHQNFKQLIADLKTEYGYTRTTILAGMRRLRVEDIIWFNSGRGATYERYTIVVLKNVQIAVKPNGVTAPVTGDTHVARKKGAWRSKEEREAAAAAQAERINKARTIILDVLAKVHPTALHKKVLHQKFLEAGGKGAIHTLLGKMVDEGLIIISAGGWVMLRKGKIEGVA